MAEFDMMPNYRGTSLVTENTKSHLISIATQMNIHPTKMQRLVDIASTWGGYISCSILHSGTRR